MSLPIYLLERVYLSTRTLGSIYSPQGGLICKTLELPWLNNQKSISCIKEGIYPVTYSPPVLADDPNTAIDESGGRIKRDYEHYIVHRVPGRTGILIHRGKTPAWSKGCITVGMSFGNINTDEPILEESAEALQWMIDNLPRSFKLRILAKSGTPYS